MDKILQSIQNFTSTDVDMLKQLVSFLQKSDESLNKHANAIDDLLVQLEPGIHSLGWAFLLAAKSKHLQPADKNIFLQQCVQFLTHCSPIQIQLAPKPVRTICQKFVDILVDAKETIRGIEPLRQAIQRIAPGPTFLTPQHWMFTLCCIQAKACNIAIPVLDQDAFQIDTDSTALDSKDVRLFFYYGGVAYMGMKKFQQAIDYFKAVITAPAVVPSAIMVEAYKKYVLASLLATGQVDSVPRYTTNTLLRHIKQLCAPYDELATAYSTHSTDDVHKCAETNHEVFNKDSNFGFVKQVASSLYRRNIQRLTKTYITLSVEDIAKTVKLHSRDAAEQEVLNCIERGEIFATVSHKDGMVSFNENPEQYDTNVTLHTLDNSLRKTMDLSDTLQTVDEQITLSQKYLEKIVGDKGGRWQGGGGASGPQDFDDVPMDVLMDRPGPFGSAMRG